MTLQIAIPILEKYFKKSDKNWCKLADLAIGNEAEDTIMEEIRETQVTNIDRYRAAEFMITKSGELLRRAEAFEQEFIEDNFSEHQSYLVKREVIKAIKYLQKISPFIAELGFFDQKMIDEKREELSDKLKTELNHTYLNLEFGEKKTLEIMYRDALTNQDYKLAKRLRKELDSTYKKALHQ